MKTKSIILGLLLSLFAAQALAAPSISSTSGTVAHGQSIVISGANFGSKSTAAPIAWLDFEEGADGDTLEEYDDPVDYSVHTGGDVGLEYSDTYNHTKDGSLTAYNDPMTRLECPAGAGLRTNYFSIPATTEVFMSYWFYMDYTSETANAIIKMPRINSSYNGNPDYYNGAGDCVVGGVSPAGPTQYLTYNDGSGGKLPSCRWLTMPNQEWFRVDYWHKRSSSAGANDGITSAWVWTPDGSPVDSCVNNPVINMAEGYGPWDYEYIWLGCAAANYACTDDFEMYVDDMYVDNTPARVEIGNNATFASCTHREIQIPSAWAAGEITFTLNQGAISDANLTNGNYYLFVVDEDGSVSPGFQLTGKSAALTGSATDGVTEAEIVAGSEEIIITLTNDTWVATAGADNQFTTDLIAAIDSGGAEAAGWDVQVKGTLAHGDFTRTSDTVMTIVLPAVAAYEITTNETITIAIPANNLTGAAIITTPTFEVTAASDPAAALTGTFADNALEAEIVTGGEDIIITLTNDTWVAAGGVFDGERQAIIDGLDSAQSETTGWDAEVKGKEVVTAVVRTNATTVTITLTAQAAYDISANETVTVTVPASALVTSGSPVVATPTADIIFFETTTEKIVGMTLQ